MIWNYVYPPTDLIQMLKGSYRKEKVIESQGTSNYNKNELES